MIRQEASELDRTLAALADPTRRAILDRLARGEARVTDIANRFDISLNSVSKHIRKLERARLVERRVVGRDHILRIRPESLDTIERWLARKTAFWRAQLEALDELLKTEQKKNRRT